MAPEINGGNQSYSEQFVHVYQLPSISYALIEEDFASSARIPNFDPQEYLASITTPQEYKILWKIAWCESGWKMKWNYMNPTGDPTSKWSAYGYFQIVRSTALATDYTLDRFNPRDNITLAVKLAHRAGFGSWEASRNCWSR